MQLTKVNVIPETRNLRLVKIDELYAYLNKQIPKDTLKRMATSGEIPSLKIGRHRLYDLDAIDEWLLMRGGS